MGRMSVYEGLNVVENAWIQNLPRKRQITKSVASQTSMSYRGLVKYGKNAQAYTK